MLQTSHKMAMEKNAIKSRVVGVDITVNTTVLGIVDVRGNIIAKDTLLTSDYPDPNEFITDLSEKIIVLAEASGGYESIRSVGISAPSANFVTGCIETASNLHWKGVVPLAGMLRDRLGLAVAVSNDAHVTALGEYAYGIAHGMKNFIIISLGHGGIGSSIFSNGHAHLGVHGYAGEFGHTCIVPNGRRCSCGRIGCLEEYASARGIRKMAEDLLATSDTPSAMREGDLSFRSIAAYCAQGDALATQVCESIGQILGTALANYASLLDPEAIILTGELTQMGDCLLRPIRKAFDEHVFHNIENQVKLQVSILDDSERDMLGASALAWEVKEYSLFK